MWGCVAVILATVEESGSDAAASQGVISRRNLLVVARGQEGNDIRDDKTALLIFYGMPFTQQNTTLEKSVLTRCLRKNK